jgi:RimJ/RimL family protein N-acetyltransferase
MKNQARVRDAHSGDVKGIHDLLVRVVTDLDIYSEAARASEIAQYDETYLAEIVVSGIVLVAEDEIGPCGFCFGYDDDALIWLSWFIVSPEHRGGGLGTSLIRAFLRRASTRTHKVWCDTRSNNEVSKSILRKCHFEELITIDRHWYDQSFTIWQKIVR